MTAAEQFQDDHQPRDVADQETDQDPPADSLVHPILALEALGWHVIGLRQRQRAAARRRWRVAIERYDESATMTLVDADPGAALAELVRYARADAADAADAA